MENLFFSLRSRRSILAVCVLAFAPIFAASAMAQQDGPGSVDDGFVFGGVLQTASAGVFATLPQSDGTIIVAGNFTVSLNGTQASTLARLNSDGSLDTGSTLPVLESYNTRTDSFVTSLDPTYFPLVRVLLQQSDGKILVGGNFYFVNGVSGFGGLVRLNPDGSVDSSFHPPRFAGTVNALAISPDGRCYVGGNFTQVDTRLTNCLVRLKSNGSLDKGFDAGQFADIVSGVQTTPSVNALVVQSDSKVVVGGLFSQVGSTVRTGLARLSTTGEVDGGYDPSSSASFALQANATDQVLALALQADGKVLAGLQLQTLPGRSFVTPNSLFRLNADGSVDDSFNPGGTGTDNSVNTILLGSDGDVYIGGNFSIYDGLPRNTFARLSADGALDQSFDSSVGGENTVFNITQQPDGKLLIGGYFQSVDQVTRRFLSRINDTATIPAVTVSIAATANRAMVGTPARKGFFTVERAGGNLTVPLIVYYTVAGTATAGVDYRALSGAVTIPAGQTTARIKVKALQNPVYFGRRKVIATLALASAPNPLDGSFTVGGYGISGGERAIVKIFGVVPPVN